MVRGCVGGAASALGPVCQPVGWVWPVLGYLGTHQHCHHHMTRTSSRAHHSMTRWCWVLSASVSTKCHFIGCKFCSPVKLIEIQWDTDNGQAILRLSFGPPEASITWVLDLEWTFWPSSSHLVAAQSEDICDVVDVLSSVAASCHSYKVQVQYQVACLGFTFFTS